jgi:gluconolactonase
MNLLAMRQTALIGVPVAILMTMAYCTRTPEWHTKNEELIAKYDLTKRELSGIPESSLEPDLEPGTVKSLESLPQVEPHPNVRATISWGTGVMLSMLELAPHTEIPEEVLPADRFVFVLEGSISQLINGTPVTMISRDREEPDGIHSTTPRTDFLYLEEGARSAVIAGDSGAKLLEVYSPQRLDYLQKAGVKGLPNSIQRVKNTAESNIVAGKVYDLYDMQRTKLSQGVYGIILSAKQMQLSFVSMEPGTTFSPHIHPEEQLELVLRGDCRKLVLDEKQELKSNDLLRIPGNMVHGAEAGAVGYDALSIFWPVRPDYLDMAAAATRAFRAIIPEDAQLELVVDGKKTKPELHFTEGPKWMNGKLYFSNMYFDQDFNADPRRSSTVELDPSGSYRNITEGKMQTNGLYPYKNGNLLVCDMMGHRIVEMTTTGKVVRVVVDSYDGKPIDGPNDIVVDSKGGFYFTDPQFTMEPEKSQPGRAVYYVSSNGKITRLLEPNAFAMPNGIVLSPDGKTLYINNCYDDETWYPVDSDKDNHIWAYDVNADGTISNGRKFATLLLTENVLDRKGKSSSADGMTIDKAGNLYVATYYGVQIFNPDGEFVGMINLPSFPVSLCFGDDDMKTLYIVSYSKVYRIRTNMEGFVQYL